MDEGEHTGWWSYGQNDGELVTALALQRSPPLEANAFSQELIGAAQGSQVLQDLQIDLQRGQPQRPQAGPSDDAFFAPSLHRAHEAIARLEELTGLSATEQREAALLQQMQAASLQDAPASSAAAAWLRSSRVGPPVFGGPAHETDRDKAASSALPVHFSSSPDSVVSRPPPDDGWGAVRRALPESVYVRSGSASVPEWQPPESSCGEDSRGEEEPSSEPEEWRLPPSGLLHEGGAAHAFATAPWRSPEIRRWSGRKSLLAPRRPGDVEEELRLRSHARGIFKRRDARGGRSSLTRGAVSEQRARQEQLRTLRRPAAAIVRPKPAVDPSVYGWTPQCGTAESIDLSLGRVKIGGH